MPRFLLSTFMLGALLSASTLHTQAQSDTHTGTAATDPWGTSVTTTDADVPGYPTGWSTAPGISLSVHQRPTTDYRGRPLKKQPKPKRVAAAELATNEPSDDPMMHSSGVMIAPGMNTAPYRGVSTDYHGRPIQKKSRNTSTMAAKAAKAAPIAVASSTSW